MSIIRALVLTSGLAFALAIPGQAEEAFPVSVKNCGATLTLNAAPKRIFMVNTDDVALLGELDALDRLVALTSKPAANLYDTETYEALAKVPLVATERGPTGGDVISLEAIIATQPDLVLAPESAVDRQTLAEAGISLYSPPAYCNDKTLIPGGTASFDLVYEQLETFGRLLGESDLAAQRVTELKAKVALLSDKSADHGTGFALYVAAGGKTLYPYGAKSMVTPVFAAAGLTNVYGQTDERVFEASTEELLGKNPDVIVLLYSEDTPEAVLASFNAVPGVETFEAVKKGSRCAARLLLHRSADTAFDPRGSCTFRKACQAAVIGAQAVTVSRNGKRLVDAVSLEVRTGEILAIVGPNGSGKTTLLRGLYGVCALDAGQVFLDGAPIKRMSRRAVAKRIAVVPQGQSVDGEQSVIDMVSLGRLPHQPWYGARGSSDEAAIGRALERVSLLPLVHHPLRRLSGGEVQRALIARAICQEADHLMLDEPTNHLDLAHQHDILSFIRQLGLTTIIVLHDLNLAARYCDRIALINEGRLVAIGSPDIVLTPERVAEIYRVPATRFISSSGRQHLLFADTPFAKSAP